MPSTIPCGTEAHVDASFLKAFHQPADEIAVEAFLDFKIPFPAIPRVVEGVLEQTRIEQLASVDDVLAADRQARELARSLVRDTAVPVGS